MSIQRYMADSEGYICDHSDGPYVRYEDVAPLLADAALLERLLSMVTDSQRWNSAKDGHIEFEILLDSRVTTGDAIRQEFREQLDKVTARTI